MYMQQMSRNLTDDPTATRDLGMHPPARGFMDRIGNGERLGRLPAALLIAIAAAGCSSGVSDEQTPPPAPQVSVAEVVSRDVQQWDEFTGRIEAVKSVQIRPRVSGYIEQVHYTEGSEVAKGEVLFVIDQRPYRAELARTEAELARARAQYEVARSEMIRARRLLETRAISQEDHDRRIAGSTQAQAGVAAAEAALEAARLNMEFTEVRAPISGRTGRALVTEGNLVNAGETVLTNLVSLDPVHVYFEGDERIYLRYKELVRRSEQAGSGSRVNPVFVGLSDETGFPHEGYVDFVDNQVNPDTGTIRVRAVLPNADRLFTPGLFARVKLIGSGTYNASLVDDKAILTDQDRRYVYIIDDNNLAQRRDVKPARLVDGLRVITEGLAAGDRVVVHGVQKIFFPGMPVDPQMIAMGDPPASPPAQPAAESGEAEGSGEPKS